MRHKVFIMALASMALAGTSLWAQNEQIRSKVPFAFKVNEETFPAGEYRLSPADAPDLTTWMIRNEKTGAEADFLTEGISSTEPARKTELQFDKVDGQYFLSKLWIEGEDGGREILPSKGEKSLTQSLKSSESKMVPGHHMKHSKKS